MKTGESDKVKQISYQAILPVLFFLFAFSIPPEGIENTVTEATVTAAYYAGAVTDQQAELTSGQESLILPLKNAGRLFMIDAVIDGQSGNLIFDSGAAGIVLNKTYFRKYVPINSRNSNGITGNVDKVSVITVGSLKASDLEMTKFQAQVADLSHIENQKGVKVLGLFGFEILKNFEIVIDVNHQALHLYRIDSKGNKKAGTEIDFPSEYTQTFETSGGVVFIRGVISGRELKFCLDTGAETNVISSSATKSVLNTITITRKSDLRGVGSSKSEVLFGTMTDFKYGGKEMVPMSTVITNLGPLCEAYNTSLDGMLGYDFLKKGVYCINFRKRQIGIIFNKNI